MKRSRLVGLAGALLWLVWAELAAAQQAPGFSQRVASLRSKVRTQGAVRVIVTVPSGGAASAMASTRSAMVSMAQGIGAEAVREIPGLPLAAMTVRPAQLDALLASGQITDVVEDKPEPATLDTTIPLIGADNVHSAGYLGNARTVAILDTGVDNDHLDLNVVWEGCYSTTSAALGVASVCPGGISPRVNVAGSAEACENNLVGMGGCDHGTHVAGIAAGANGVAQNARILAFQVFTRITDAAGGMQPHVCADAGETSPCMLSFPSDQLAALQQVNTLRTAGTFVIDAVNMSLGGGSFASACDGDTRAAPINTLLAGGVTTTIASGNAGLLNAIGSPACITSAVAVGNTTDLDVVAPTSNAGPMLDLWAPGTFVNSTVPAAMPGVADDLIGPKSGTSMSSPHVAGAIALLRSIDPALSPAAALSHLIVTGVTVTDTRVGGTIQRPRINVLGAARAVSNGLVTPENSDKLSQTIATGDFNNDTFTDVAVGVEQTVGGVFNAGAVDVFYGSDIGPAVVQVWTQSTGGVVDSPEAGDGFGRALASGDFNNDGFFDLAIGVPAENTLGVAVSGAVHVLYGTVNGLTATASQFWSQDPLADAPEANDQFGASLATGDFNGDGNDDLVVGAPGETVGAANFAGAVNVIYGSVSGLSATAVIANQFWTQDSDNIESTSAQFESFGKTLATGDFNNDNRDDLAIGVPYENVGAVSQAGGVNVIYGSNAGLRAVAINDQFWTQDSAGILDSAETMDQFGLALAGGDFNNDGSDDLAIGVPGETINTFSGAGSVNVLYGAVGGITSANNQFWNQDQPSVEGGCEAADVFGNALSAADFNVDGFADLAIGANGENSIAGFVHVIHGSASRLSATIKPDLLFSQDTAGVPETAETGDGFGRQLAAGDFNSDGRTDLAVAVPNEGFAPTTNAGMVDVLFQAPGGAGLTGAGSIGLTE